MLDGRMKRKRNINGGATCKWTVSHAYRRTNVLLHITNPDLRAWFERQSFNRVRSIDMGRPLHYNNRPGKSKGIVYLLGNPQRTEEFERNEIVEALMRIPLS